MHKRLCVFLSLGVLASACVPKSKYDDAVLVAANRAKFDASELQRVQNDLAAAQARVQEREAKITELDTSQHNLQARIDEATAVNQQLRNELQRLGQDVDQLLKDKGSLSKSLNDAKTRLEELRKAQAAAEKRAALFQELVQKFKRMVDAGNLKIVLRDGRLVLQLPNDVLFDSGKVDIKPAGKETLTQVAQALHSIRNRHFQVAGHTDDVPIRTARFRSNWELSTARAVEVVRLLIESGLQPEVLSAAGYGEFDPVAPNTSADGKARNRRIEITLQPNIDELVSIPN